LPDFLRREFPEALLGLLNAVVFLIALDHGNWHLTSELTGA
jgi:hypothetical protein